MNKRLEQLLKMLNDEPGDPFLHYGIALEYVSGGDYVQAEAWFKKLLSINPGYVPAYMQYAQLLERLERPEEAKDIYRAGIAEAVKSGDKHAAKEMEDFLDELD